jgi:ferredoxin
VKERFLRVDPTICAGHGICAELFPEMVRLDDWGYPIIEPVAVPVGLMGMARRTVSECPALALALADHPGPRAAAVARQRIAAQRSAGRKERRPGD